MKFPFQLVQIDQSKYGKAERMSIKKNGGKKKEKVWELFKNRTQLKGIHTFLAKIT